MEKRNLFKVLHLSQTLSVEISNCWLDQSPLLLTSALPSTFTSLNQGFSIFYMPLISSSLCEQHPPKHLKGIYLLPCIQFILIFFFFFLQNINSIFSFYKVALLLFTIHHSTVFINLLTHLFSFLFTHLYLYNLIQFFFIIFKYYFYIIVFNLSQFSIDLFIYFNQFFYYSLLIYFFII